MVDQYLNNIIEGDCLELLKTLPDNSIDVAFADPPFNLKKSYNSYKDHLNLQEYLDWCELWIIEMVRITKPTGSIFLHNIPKWLTFYTAYLNEIADFKHWISWDAPTAPMGKTLQPSHYGILFYAKDINQLKFYEIRYPHKRTRKKGLLAKDYGGKKKLLHPFGPLVSDVWTDIHRVKHNKYRDKHPCQLPVHLLERLILMSSDEGDIILDPFVGTGTTALAAKRLGRKFMGFERDNKYVEIAKAKLLQENFRSKLGEYWVSFYLNNVVTLRDKDWCGLKTFYHIPAQIEKIDHMPIVLKSAGVAFSEKKQAMQEEFTFKEDAMTFGQGDYVYTVQENWWTLPEGWSFGWVPAVAVDSQDRVYVYSRSEHPMVVFDREGNFLSSWGEDVLKDAHGIYIDAEDHVYCVERNTHCLRKFSCDGELLMTVGTPDREGDEGEPFRLPTDVAFDSEGFMYVSDGYGNARMHKFTPDGELIKSWGEPGTGPGQFDLVHSVRVDKDDRLWVADRSNNRIQFFDTEGNFQGEWTGLHQPDTVYIDDDDGVVYIAELEQRVSIWTVDGEKLSEWGRGVESDIPGEFKKCPHGIWLDSHGDLYVGEVQADARLQKFIRQR